MTENSSVVVKILKEKDLETFIILWECLKNSGSLKIKTEQNIKWMSSHLLQRGYIPVWKTYI